MSILYIILCSVLILVCVALNVMILLQKKRASGLGGTMTGMSGEQSYVDKNKGRTVEGQLERYSKIGGAALMIIVLALNIVQ